MALKIIIKLFGPAVFVYSANILAVKLGVYSVFPAIDMIMHGAGGAAIGILALVAWSVGLGLYEDRIMISIPLLIKGIAVIGFVAVVGIAWEWYEFFLDVQHINQGREVLLMQPSIGDTMADLFFDLCGGIIVFLFHETVLRRKR